MIQPTSSAYSSLDFLEWREKNALELSPKFQRRGVWTRPARSYLIDTLIQQMLVPPIYLRERQSDDKKRIIREVVDGQQRISAVLDFLDGKFAISGSLDAPYAGRRFDALTLAQQDAIRTFKFTCLMLGAISDAEVLQIFARLNTYSVKLNNQELRNGKFYGYFKQLAYRLALDHLEFWRNAGIFTDRRIARMLEVELTSELLIAELDGLQDKKKSIDRFYREFDAEFPNRQATEARFRETIASISETIAPDGLAESEFSRPPLFYSLFCATYHRLFGIPKLSLKTPKRRLNRTEHQSLQESISLLSEQVQAVREGNRPRDKFVPFVNACLRQTDNLQPRLTRITTLYQQAFK
jgi:Protein of unknown function DUF262